MISFFNWLEYFVQNIFISKGELNNRNISLYKSIKCYQTTTITKLNQRLSEFFNKT